MISTTTLILATLVFNAASSFGAPVRHITARDAVEPVVARAHVDQPLIRRAEYVEVEPQVKRSNLGRITRRSVRLPREVATENEVRDTASTESVEAREALPEVEEIVRRFPRRHLHDFYKRSADLTPREVADEPQVERRFARRALHERFVKRQDTPAAAETPAATPADASASASASATDASATASATDAAAATSTASASATDAAAATSTASASVTDAAPTPSATSTDAAATPSATSTDAAAVTTTSASASASDATSSASATSTATATSTGAASATATASGSPAANTKTSSGIDIGEIVKTLEKTNSNGRFQPGQTTKETTVIVSKITYDSNGKKDEKPQVSATTTTLGDKAAAPTGTSTSTSSTSSAAAGEATPGAAEVKTDAAAATPSAAPADAAATPAPADAGAGAAPAARRSATLIRRNLGYSGAAYASLLKRNVNMD